MSKRLQENLFLARTFKNWNEHIEMMKKTNSQKVSFIFERMNGFLKQSSCYELLFYITIVAKEKKWRKNLGVETTKKFIHSVNSSQVREWGKIQAFLLSIVVKICIRSKKEK